MGTVAPGEIGYMIHPAYWGQGYATEALRAFLEVLFKRNLEREAYVAVVDGENPASSRVLEKLGFKRRAGRVEGEKQTWENPTLGTREAVTYDITREGFERAT
jgi:RimJ/RimL family protein N-acetyltransferase